MSTSRHTEAQMIGALKQLEAGCKAEDVAREVGASKAHDLWLEGELRQDGRERGPLEGCPYPCRAPHHRSGSSSPDRKDREHAE